jgi:hypothetical protein
LPLDISLDTGKPWQGFTFIAFFQFSDMVLLCSIRNNYLGGQQYQLRAKLEVGEMTISEGDDLEVLNTFYIQDDHKRIELYTE